MSPEATSIPPSGLLTTAKVLVGEAVLEPAMISTRDGWLTIEFEADGLDNIAVRLSDLNAR